jgi:hypothetical protein
LRNRVYRKLGIYHNNSVAALFTPPQANCKRHKENLPDARDSPIQISDDDASIDTTEGRTYSVSFATEVFVHEIPHFSSYDNKNDLWSNRTALNFQARRNKIERAYERCHWRDAIEEDYFCQLQDGRLVHPAHVSRQFVAYHHQLHTQRREEASRRYELNVLQHCRQMHEAQRQHEYQMQQRNYFNPPAYE